jgi:hypothetical protein
MSLATAHPLGIRIKEGFVRLYNTTYHLAEAVFSPTLTIPERKLYTGQQELSTEMVELYLKTGQATYRDGQLVITTSKPGASYAVRGTDVSFEVEQDGTTTLQVMHGTVTYNAYPGSSPMALYPGESLTVEPGKPPARGRMEWNTVRRWWQTGPLEALLTISVAQHDCQIQLDGQGVGGSPIQTTTSPGPHQVKIEKEGYQTWSRIVNLLSGATSVHADLIPTEPTSMRSVHTVFAEDEAFNVTTWSDSTIPYLGLNIGEGSIQILASGPKGGICDTKVTVPLSLLEPDYTVLVDGTQIPHTATAEDTTGGPASIIGFTHTQGPQVMVEIKGRYTIPQDMTVQALILTLVALIPSLILRREGV